MEELSLRKSGGRGQVTCVDIDGNVYQTIKIGNKIWMAENLRVTRYRNGQAISQVTGAADWAACGARTEKGAWCFYQNNSVNNRPYGKLYNWYATTDPRGLAPQGWHIPSNEEWIELSNALGGYQVAGGKMKTTGTLEAGDGLWTAPNKNATNSSGFSAVPAGERSASGSFNGKSIRTRWWTTDRWEGDAFTSYILDINLFGEQAALFNSSGETVNTYNALAGLSVRCVKD